MAETDQRSGRADGRGEPIPAGSTIELAVRAALHDGDPTAAAARAVHAHGSEIFGFLVAVLGDVNQARAAYAAFGQRTTATLARFRWRCTLRIFLYFNARRDLRQVAERPRTRTTDAALLAIRMAQGGAAPYRRRPMEGFAEAVRRCLRRADLELLVLRVDRRFTWAEVATSSLGESASRRNIEEEAARARERFRWLKARIARAADSRKG